MTPYKVLKPRYIQLRRPATGLSEYAMCGYIKTYISCDAKVQEVAGPFWDRGLDAGDWREAGEDILCKMVDYFNDNPPGASP